MEFKTDWITVQQAMQLLQITSRTTLYKFSFKYNIRVTKPMGRVYYNLSDIVSTLANKSVKMGI